MRLELILPRVEPTKITPPTMCPDEGCQGRHFGLLQEVDKALRDTVYVTVKARRYACLRCKRTFRVYPEGVSQAQTSQRVHGLAVMLYLLGLSYGAVSLALDALGVYLCKSRVYEVVQAAAERVPGLKRDDVYEGKQTPALGGDLTGVKCNGRWLPLGITVDDITGLVLTLDELSGEDAQTLKSWLEPIATAVGARLLVSAPLCLIPSPDWARLGAAFLIAGQTAASACWSALFSLSLQPQRALQRILSKAKDRGDSRVITDAPPPDRGHLHPFNHPLLAVIVPKTQDR